MKRTSDSNLLRFLTILALSLPLMAVDLTAFKTPQNSWDDAFEAARKAGRIITLPGGKYELQRTIEVGESMTLVFEEGAELNTSITPMIHHTGGTLVLEGRGLPGVLSSSVKGERGWMNPNRAAVIDLNDPSAENPPTLILRNLEFRSFNGIDGYWMKDGNRNTVKNDIAALEIDNCRFFCEEKGIAANGSTIHRARIENCLFEGCDNPIHLNVPMPGGINVLNNELRDFGRFGMQLGKGGQVSDGCTTHLSNAIVKGNRLLKGGRGSKVTESYIHGILIYGNNVVVEGNIVRDVTRGEPVLGEPIGHQIVQEDGTALRGHWVERDGKRVRLAGSAIYLKANRSLVMGNICTNSGYRSVIEIKTGGKEPFVSVCNNIVDGRSLDIDESFGFECNSGRSVWMNNVVYDMPHQAFVVRSGYENTFLNNLIVNAKVGFGLSGSVPGQGEWINGNRFVNVEVPVAYDGKEARPANVPEATLPGPVYLDEAAELPDPSPEWNGRMLVHGKTVYLGVVDGGVSKWMEFSGKVVEPKQYTAVGPELAFNADQSGSEQSDDPALNDPAFPGWSITMRTATEKPLDPHDGYVTFDTEVFKTGGRSLKVFFPEYGSEWRARQRIQVQPGKRYRATALVRGEESRNFYLSVTCGGKSVQARGVETQDWQTLSVEFNAKASSCDFIIRGAKTSPRKGAWLDSISLRKVVEEGTENQTVDEDRTAKLVPVGEELLTMPQAEDGKLKRGWGIAGCAHEVSAADGTFRLQAAEKGNLSLTSTVTLQPGNYRYELEFAEETSKFRLSVKLPDGKRLSGKAVGPLKYQCDFTLDAEGKVQLGLWGGTLTSGEGVALKNLSLKALAPPPPQLP